MIKKIKIILFISTCFFNYETKSQYAWPIDSNLQIVSNYGEIRSNHFHSGIDLSTDSKLNQKLYAIESGFISRIKVSSGSYGNAIYITHPNDKVSVYAHLNSYISKISELVKKEQYLKKSFEIEIFPKPNTFLIKKNELIGFSGNTGNSTGPHLHFEIRDEHSELPINPLEFYKTNDKSAPVISQIAFYDISDTILPKFDKNLIIKKNKNDSLFLETDHINLDYSKIGIAFSGYDLTSTGNKVSIYQAKLILNGNLIYSHIFNGVHFANTRYVNEYCDKKDNQKFQKCFLPTLFPNTIYRNCLNKGRIDLNNSDFNLVILSVEDEYKNKKELQFYIRSNIKSTYKNNSMQGDSIIICSKDFHYSKNNILIKIPSNTLYNSSQITIKNSIKIDGKLALYPSNINLNSAFIIGYKVPKKLINLKRKLFITNKNNTIIPKIINDSLYFESKNFGTFHLVIDTIPPKIKINKNSEKNSISCLVYDDLSGVLKCDFYINNSWVLAEYDAKNKLVKCVFDKNIRKGNLKLKIVAQDKLGNLTTINKIIKN